MARIGNAFGLAVPLAAACLWLAADRSVRASETTTASSQARLGSGHDDNLEPPSLADLAAAVGGQTGTRPEDMARSRAWTAGWLSDPARLPVSFLLDGKPIAGIPADWQPVATRRRIDANITETVFEGRDPQTGVGLRVECTQYLDYPVVEWVGRLSNTSDQPSPILSEILAFDGSLAGGSPVLQHSNGDFYSQQGYTQQETALSNAAACRFSPSGGRPCDQAFPYFRIAFPQCGVSLAIGWPAQWSASFTGLADGVHVRAGQETTHLRLMPGETIRTPRITLMSWTGDAARAANLWRRWYRAHILPRPAGQPLRPRLVGHGTADGEEFTAATEANQIQFIRRWAQQGIPFDVWWIDAGWYPCYDKEGQRRWPLTGTWQPDPERFPRGLKRVSDEAAKHGADLLIWVEPERVTPGSQLDREHPEWLLRCAGADNRLLNLGDASCRQWLTDHVCGLIRDNGIKIYRQDHNFAPLEYWRTNEAEDRQGMNENLHVQGYLQYWDDLLARNPGLWIDSCASGGRRNDLESMRRAVPLHYTDFGYGNHPVKLSFHHMLYQWLPYFKEVTLSWDQEPPGRYDRRVDSFSYHCGLGPMLIPCIDIRRDDYDYALLRRMLHLWRPAAEMMLEGDYYPLTPIHRSPEQWVARQFDCPETGRGFIQGIRLPAAKQESLTVQPRVTRPDAVYLLINPETRERKELTGQALQQDGITFSLAPRQGSVWFYRVK